jgi:hypothetical protein
MLDFKNTPGDFDNRLVPRTPAVYNPKKAWFMDVSDAELLFRLTHSK